jgi:predicted aldo/keto reductase-like oxidoreductase
MPCPQKVNIPGCFAAYNASFANGFVTGLTQYITGTGANNPQNNSTAHNCVKCGHCKRHCPQHIEIMASLAAATKRMEPFWIRIAFAIMNKLQKSQKQRAAGQ